MDNSGGPRKLGPVDVDELRERYSDLVVPACEWRAMGLADPHDMAEEVFARLDSSSGHSLKDLYASIDKVVLATYQRYAGATSVLDKLRSGMVLVGPRSKRTPADDFLEALSNLRGADRNLIQLRFWDDLDDAEAGEVLGLNVEGVRERLARAGTRYLGKLSRSHPDLALTDVEDTVRSIKPGVYRRFPGG